jgi:hypothetical protein
LWKSADFWGKACGKKLYESFVAPFTLASCRLLLKVPHLGLAGGAVNSPLSFGIARMCAAAEQLPQRQFWVGEVRSDSAMFTVTLTLYGEAVLTVVCTHFP